MPACNNAIMSDMTFDDSEWVLLTSLINNIKYNQMDEKLYKKDFKILCDYAFLMVE